MEKKCKRRIDLQRRKLISKRVSSRLFMYISDESEVRNVRAAAEKGRFAFFRDVLRADFVYILRVKLLA